MIRRLLNYLKNPANNKIIENIFSLGGLKAATMLLPLIIIPHLIRSIGMELVGLLAVVSSISAYLRTLIDYGFVYTGTREVSRNNLNKEKNTYSFYIITYCKIILILISFFIILCLSLFINFIHDNLILLIISLANVSIASLSPAWFFQGVEDMKKIAGGEVAGKIFSFFLIIFLVKDEKDILFVPGFYLLGQLMSLAVYFIFLKKYIFLTHLPTFNVHDVKSKLIDGWSMFINILLPNFYNNYSYLAVGYFSNLSAVAAYDIIRKIMNISEQAMGILSKVYYPSLASNFKRFSTFLRVIFVAAALLTILQLVLSVIGTYLLKDSSIVIDPKLLYLQAIAPLIFAANLAYGINSLGVNNKDRQLRNITLATSFIGFILVSLLTYYFAAFGALSGVLLTMLIRAIICYKTSKSLNLYAYIRN
ncbi:oligosaccharide flippase family protein [Psychrobacter sp. FDAARGOS_221]|uniref:oligosaccharide flippase family protein n=1 Tax=Psychrobacter sp. FDAARGOS_221 TaxID=1975705 RepID=UPI000BB55CD6|nr:oligosaccharide flippase family protein [Psychrobacter sp. FDAARGOS_221]PNK60503.1 flippase [Psychrobacter sp. FDAARGOS_221]